MTHEGAFEGDLIRPLGLVTLYFGYAEFTVNRLLVWIEETGLLAETPTTMPLGHRIAVLRDTLAALQWAAKLKEATARVRTGSDLFENYTEFPSGIRKQAEEMAVCYQLFYCFEQSIRNMITDTLQDAVGTHWWDSDKIKDNLRTEAQALYMKELSTGRRARSARPIDYTTFGQLISIIQQNWELFSGRIKNKDAVGAILSGLNLQRGPIAHCCLLLPDEVQRMTLLMRDWFQNLIRPI